MRYGLYMPNFGPFGDPKALIALAQEAEVAGWDGFFIWDHVNRDSSAGPVADPWVALAGVAATTQRIRLGAMVTPLPRRRPWKVARETVTLDHLSNGRLIFGAGIGSGRTMEWDDFGERLEPKVRAAMLDEGLDVLAGLWTGAPFSYDGGYYFVDDVHFIPPPLQQPRIPVWIGGEWPAQAPMRRAARWDGAFPLFHAAGDDPVEILSAFKDCVAFLRTERADNEPFDITHLMRTPGDDPARAAEMAAPFIAGGATWLLESVSLDRFGDAGFAGARERVIQGPPKA
jgi:alkanesulfonate monooxygenase SsuD/methylene tetrahydromethanopterin reductase-like flavin-dependent oxidoreductase (luciferase family)